jgi:hypothetical protein
LTVGQFNELKETRMTVVDDDERARDAAIESELLPGPYRINPATDQAMRLEYQVPERGHVVVTDVFGGCERTITADEWNEWKRCGSND